MWQATLNQLVTSYLAHHGYRKTALTFARDSQTAILEADVSIQARQTISAHLLAGHLQEAVEATNRFFPGVLEANPHLFFRLQARKFVEQVAVRSAADYSSLEPLLSFGQELQSMCDSPRFASDANRKILQVSYAFLLTSIKLVGLVPSNSFVVMLSWKIAVVSLLLQPLFLCFFLFFSLSRSLS